MKGRVEGNRPARPIFRPEDIREIVERTPFVSDAVKRREKKG